MYKHNRLLFFIFGGWIYMVSSKFVRTKRLLENSSIEKIGISDNSVFRARRYELVALNPITLDNSKNQAISGATPVMNVTAFSFNSAYVEMYRQIIKYIKDEAEIDNKTGVKIYVSLMYNTNDQRVKRIVAFSYYGNIEPTEPMEVVLAGLDELVDNYEFCVVDTTGASDYTKSSKNMLLSDFLDATM